MAEKFSGGGVLPKMGRDSLMSEWTGAAANKHQLESMTSHRRLDIQGLRAIAVVMVVAFHAGLPVPGGFVGVDVFFVISGFVITTMLQREWVSSGRIRFRQFYLKRFKRLTPALALLVSITLIASAVVLSPLGPQEIAAKTGIGAMLLSANFVIARSTGGYFDPAAATNPLLNTWSLSVEEQFYLVFPAVIFLGWYLARRTAKLRSAPFLLVSGIAVLSFLLALTEMLEINLRGGSWILGFYSPFTRVWEFAVGALLALALTKFTISLPSRMMLLLGAAGLAMLVLSLWLISESATFPGPWTLLPVSGTLLLIFSGTQDNAVSRSLSTSPMVRMGDWSYSVYLWHWPFIVFSIYIWPFSSYAPVLAVLVAFVPALASYHWLEQPIRQHAIQSRIKIVKLIMIVTIPPIILAALLGLTAERYWQPQYTSGAVPALYENDGNWLDFYEYLGETYFPCSNFAIRENTLTWEGIERCRQSKPSANVDIAVIGDSHAEMLFLGLAERLPNQNVAYYIHNSLPIDDGASMSVIIENVERDSSIQTVIVNGDWAERGVPEIELVQTLDGLIASGKQVFITDDVPIYPFDTRDCLFGASRLLAITRCSQDIDYFQSSYSRYYPILERAVREVPGVNLLNSAQYFCDDESCKMTYKDKILYRDYNHLNNFGSRYVVDQLLENDPEFKKVLTPGQ